MARRSLTRAAKEVFTGAQLPESELQTSTYKVASSGTARSGTKNRRADQKASAAKNEQNGTVGGDTSSVQADHSTDKKQKARARSSAGKAAPVKVAEEEIEVTTEHPADEVAVTPSKKGRKRKLVQYKEEEEDEDKNDGVAQSSPPSAQKSQGKKKAKVEKVKVKGEVKVEDDVNGTAVLEKKTQRKRKTKEEKEAEAMPLAARTTGHKMCIGAHVSSAGGVQNAILNSVHIGANAFALFLKSQRKWANPPLSEDHCTSWHNNCKTHSYEANKHVVPHGSYLVNLAHTDDDRTKQAFDSFLDDLKRCERLGISLYNFHPGNVQGVSRPEALAHLASNLNRAHKETKNVVTLLENMAAGGNVIGSTFEDLRDIIANVDDKDRIGVCLDTCHAFAGGYDLRTAEALDATLNQLDETVGLKYLRALHINDSKAPFNSHRDLHANIGTGFLGLRAFHAVVNEPRLEGLPLVLETPIDVRDDEGDIVKDEKGNGKEDKAIWAQEIKMLESLVGMDVESAEFQELEAKLARKGGPERSRVEDQVVRREEKSRTKAKKGTEKGKKGKQSDSELSSAEFG